MFPHKRAHGQAAHARGTEPYRRARYSSLNHRDLPVALLRKPACRLSPSALRIYTYTCRRKYTARLETQKQKLRISFSLSLSLSLSLSFSALGYRCEIIARASERLTRSLSALNAHALASARKLRPRAIPLPRLYTPFFTSFTYSSFLTVNEAIYEDYLSRVRSLVRYSCLLARYSLIIRSFSLALTLSLSLPLFRERASARLQIDLRINGTSARFWICARARKRLFSPLTLARAHLPNGARIVSPEQ